MFCCCYAAAAVGCRMIHWLASLGCLKQCMCNCIYRVWNWNPFCSSTSHSSHNSLWRIKWRIRLNTEWHPPLKDPSLCGFQNWRTSSSSRPLTPERYHFCRLSVLLQACCDTQFSIWLILPEPIGEDPIAQRKDPLWVVPSIRFSSVSVN
jgi:hypothetical protein